MREALDVVATRFRERGLPAEVDKALRQELSKVAEGSDFEIP